MEPLMTFGQSVLVVIVGLLLRLLIAIVGLAIVVVPLVALFSAIRYGTRLRERWQGVMHAGRLLLMRGLYYAPGHTWLKEEPSNALRVGIDDLARRLLTGVRALSVAEPGTELRRGDTLAVITLEERTARITAPIDATVVDVNDEVQRAPGLVSTDPYRMGWLALLAPLGGDHLRLPTGDAAREWLVQEDERLTRFFEMNLGAAAADGGEFVMPPPMLLKPEQWDALTREFLEQHRH
jgi:glycine cleavage system H protein